ncbi:hypothetical protein RIF29_07865 [Crotalaria pallida]|uniref:Uncharacterized protein n=1 Tax=Crotalaria pallida TaxID=3830 RepID=A0AAN9PC72_CROPI
MIMKSARFTTFLLIFILLLLIRFSKAHSQHQAKQRLVVDSGSKLETARSSVDVEIYHGVLTRKMMSKGVFSKSKVVTTNGAAAHCKIIGKCDHEERQGILNVKVKRKFSKRGGTLVPLNADYYYPRPHPPKNN